jgi:hypothetical protein
MQENLLQTAGERHALVLRQVMEESGEPALETRSYVYLLDFDRGSDIVHVVPEAELVPVQISP